MKIVELTIQNVLRVKAVSIKPDSSTVVIRGKNDAGKTSVIEAIWIAIGGEKAIPPKPIHEGAEKGSIFLDIGDYKITRTFTANDRSYLTVTDKRGGKSTNPQQVLNSLMSKVTIDPLQFTMIDPKEQAAILAKIAGLDFSSVNEEVKKFFEQRKSVNRTLKDKEAERKAIHDELPADLENYQEEKSVGSIMDKLEEAQEHNNCVEGYRRELAAMQKEEGHIVDEINHLEEELDRARVRLEQKREQIQNKEQALKSGDYDIIDLTQIKAELQTIGQHNAIVGKAKSFVNISNTVSALTLESDNLTEVLNGLQQSKNKSIAEADLPVEGLTFDEDSIYLNGIPFQSCSRSQQIKISTAIAISMNPELRVLRIMDGSLLDDSNMEVIRQIADTHNFQIWIERVDDSKEGTGIHIVDGAIQNGN